MRLTKGSRLPVFEAHAQGRITRAYLEPQPDDDLPRFAYEDHLARLTADDRSWPESTRRISQLRLTLEYEPRGLIARNFQQRKTSHRYRGLSRRMAARPAADEHVLSAMVGGHHCRQPR